MLDCSASVRKDVGPNPIWVKFGKLKHSMFKINSIKNYKNITKKVYSKYNWISDSIVLKKQKYYEKSI